MVFIISIDAGPLLERDDNDAVEPNLLNEEKRTSTVTENPFDSRYTGQVTFSGHQQGARLRFAPGGYPVYYVLARANGKFIGKSIRTLSPIEARGYTRAYTNSI